MRLWKKWKEFLCERLITGQKGRGLEISSAVIGQQTPRARPRFCAEKWKLDLTRWIRTEVYWYLFLWSGFSQWSIFGFFFKVNSFCVFRSNSFLCLFNFFFDFSRMLFDCIYRLGVLGFFARIIFFPGFRTVLFFKKHIDSVSESSIYRKQTWSPW